MNWYHEWRRTGRWEPRFWYRTWRRGRPWRKYWADIDAEDHIADMDRLKRDMLDRTPRPELDEPGPVEEEDEEDDLRDWPRNPALVAKLRASNH